jgi:hypothetical protein
LNFENNLFTLLNLQNMVEQYQYVTDLSHTNRVTQWTKNFGQGPDIMYSLFILDFKFLVMHLLKIIEQEK